MKCNNFDIILCLTTIHFYKACINVVQMKMYKINDNYLNVTKKFHIKLCNLFYFVATGERKLFNT